MLGLSPQQNLGIGNLGGLGGGLGAAGLGLGGALGGLGSLGGGLGTAGLGLGGSLGGTLGGLNGGIAAGVGLGGGQDSSSMLATLLMTLVLKSRQSANNGGPTRTAQRTQRNVTPADRRDNDRANKPEPAGIDRRDPDAAPVAKATVDNGALNFSDAQWDELQRALDNGGGAEEVKTIVDKALREATDATHPRDVLNKLYGTLIIHGGNRDNLVAELYPEVVNSYVEQVMNQYG